MSLSLDRSLVDDQRSASLCDCGSPGYMAAVCINPNGDEAFWLVSLDENVECPRSGNAEQPHEKVGRLPGHLQERIWGDAIRCGHPRRNGVPCRHRVREPGQVCGFHSTRAAR